MRCDSALGTCGCITRPSPTLVWGPPPARPPLTRTSPLPLRYHYPCGRVYYTPLRVQMKELFNEIVADAVKKGFVSMRCRSGPKHVPGSTLLSTRASLC